MMSVGSKMTGTGSVVQLLCVLVIFVLVLAVTFYTTKWIAGYQKQHTFNRNLRVVETMKLTNNKYIQIVEAGEVFLVIAIGKDEVTMLAQLTKEQLNDISSEGLGEYKKPNESFGKILEQLKEHLPNGRHKDE